MGYGGSTFKLLSEQRRNGTLANLRNVMDLGAQESFLFGDPGPATEFLQAFGVERPDPAETEALVNKRFVKYLWERVRIAYYSIDFDAQFETLLLDLNFDHVPSEHRNRYDLTTNCGRTEHVLNQMNCFRIIHDLTRPGGYMLHDLPWSGLFNHGLVNYKPHLFWRLCQSNYYNWIGMWLRVEMNQQATLPDNIVAFCSDQNKEVCKNYFTYDGLLTVILQKPYDKPFVCPLDMEDATMVFPCEKARKRYWTLADKEGVSKIDTYRATGFPNEEKDPQVLALEDRCRELHEVIARMEASRFWKVRTFLSQCKRALLSPLKSRRTP